MRPRLLTVLLLLTGLLFAASSLRAQVLWTGIGDDEIFSTNENWVGLLAPGPTATAQFGLYGGIYPIVRFAHPTTIGTIEFLANRDIAYNFSDYSDFATINLGGSVILQTATNPSFANVNFSNTLTLNLTNNTTGNVFSVATGATLQIDGVVSGGGHLTKTGAGTLVLTAANTYNYTGGGPFVNSTAVKQGTLHLSGGAINHGTGGDLFVGELSGDNATLLVSGGGDISGYFGVMGNGNGSTGTATISGTGSTWTTVSGMGIGYQGTGTFNVLAGATVTTPAHANNSESYIGYHSSAVGTATVSGTGSTWTTADNLQVGHFGSGTLTIAAGGAIGNAQGLIGVASTGSGAVTVDNGTWTNSAELIVGNSGTGALAISSGGDVTNTYSYIATQAGSNGTVTVDGTGSTWTNSGLLAVGQGGTGNLAITGGGAVASTEGYLGYAIGSNGSATVTGSGSNWATSLNLTVGNAGTGVLTVANGGIVSVTGGTGTVNLAASGGNGTLNIGGTAIGTAAAGGFINASAISSGSGSATLQFNTTTTGADPYYLTKDGTGGGVAVAVTGDTKIVVTGGYTVLKGTGNTYTDTTTVNGGTLADTNAGAFSANSAVELAASGNLHVHYTETIGGLEGSGTATIAGDAILTVNSTVNHLFSGGITGAGTLNVTGSGELTLTGSHNYAGGTFVDDSVLIIDEGSITHATSDLVVGHTLTTGSAIMDVANGSTVTNGIGYIAYAANTDALMTVRGSGSQWNNNDYLYVGLGGDGVLDIAAGGVVSSPETSIGHFAGGLGVVYVGGAGSKLDTANTLYLGGDGDGYLSIYSGGQVESTTVSIGADNDGLGGVAEIGDPGSLWTNTGAFAIGNYQHGYLDVYDQAAVTTNTATIGAIAGVEGALEVSTAGSFTTTDYLMVGDSGSGELALFDAGVVTTGGNAIVANTPGSTGSVYLDEPGSTWNVGNNLLVGNAGSGLLRLTDSSLLNVDAGTGAITLGVTIGSSGQLQIGYNGEGYQPGGIVNAATVTTGAGAGTILLGTTTSKASPYYLTRNGTGAGTFVTIHGATQVQQVFGYNVLGGASTYTGTTTISGGTLVAASSGAFGSSSVVLNGGTLALASGVNFGNMIGIGLAGGKLGGDGTFTSPLTLGMGVKLAPGSSPGTLSFASSLTLNDGGTLEIEIRAPSGTPGTDWDFVSVNGAFNLGSLTTGGYSLKVISLDLANNLGAVSGLTGPASWVIATAGGGITGFEAADFAIDVSSFFGGGNFTLSQSTNNLVLSFTPVPEPSTYALLALGLGFIGLTVWRKRRA